LLDAYSQSSFVKVNGLLQIGYTISAWQLGIRIAKTGLVWCHPGIPVHDGGREEFNIGIGTPGADIGADITPRLSDSSSHGESRSLGHITASFSAGVESVRDASLTERATLRRKIVLRS